MTNKLKSLKRLAVLCLIAMTAASLVAQQSSIKGLESIPSDRRSSLRDRIQKLVAGYRAQDWNMVYANLAQFPPVQESLDQFRQRLAGSYPRNVGKSLVAFVPETVVEQPASQWVVWGCATLEGGGKRETREQWMVSASWERGGWFFSELLPAAQLDAKKPVPCTAKQPKRR